MVTREAIRRELERQERSGSWLARKTGVVPSYVLMVLRGERRLTDRFAQRVAAVLWPDQHQSTNDREEGVA